VSKPPSAVEPALPAMTDDSQLSFSLPSVSRKKVTAAFDGGRLSGDSGVMLLALADRRRKVADTFAAHTGRIIETASRIRIALASCCPEAETFSLVALRLLPSGP
jgi:hypothetical protein